MLISITTPTFERSAEVIQRTYNSVMTQTHTDWEWIIVGDGIQGPYLQVVQDIAKSDPRIFFTNLDPKMMENRYSKTGRLRAIGGAFAINTALELAIGEYVAHLDDDDEYLPDCLSTLLSFLQGAEYDFVHAQAFVVGVHGKEVLAGSPTGPRGPAIYHSTTLHKKHLSSIKYETDRATMRCGAADKGRWYKVIESNAKIGFLQKPVAKYYARAGAFKWDIPNENSVQ